MKGKKWIIAGVAAVVLIAGVILGIQLFKKEKSYRVLKVLEVEGEAVVTREKIGEMSPYVNMVLQSGDNVFLKTGDMTLLADTDKYIYLEENTELAIHATGTSRNSRTTIELKSGAITNDIRNPLSQESSYQVNTPNSTMSVRGTIFRVAVYEEDGVKYTRISVFEGSVASKLKYKDGTVSDKEVVVDKGNEIIIYEDDKVTDYLSDPKPIGFFKMPKKVLTRLKEVLNEGRSLTITKEEIERILSGIIQVTFLVEGEVFGVQTTQIGEKAEQPKLSPMAEGDWDWDFETVLEEDTVISWKKGA